MDALDAFREWTTHTKPVMPVIEIENESDAIPMAKTMVESGLNLLEITLRTDAAFDAIKAIKQAVPDAIVGAGTVLSEEQVERLAALGVSFVVSPGYSERLADVCKLFDLPYVPGVFTPTELMRARESGFHFLKLFPAKIAGGLDLLKSYAGPFKDIYFCPTGGIRESEYKSYLELNNVLCVGGTWLTPKSLLAEKDWDGLRLHINQLE